MYLPAGVGWLLRVHVCVVCVGNLTEPTWKWNKLHILGKVGQFASFGWRSDSEAKILAAPAWLCGPELWSGSIDRKASEYWNTPPQLDEQQ